MGYFNYWMRYGLLDAVRIVSNLLLCPGLIEIIDAASKKDKD